MTKRMICGYEIEPHSKRFNEPARVTMHKLGSSELGFFTPDEADRLGQLLIDAAKAARSE